MKESQAPLNSAGRWISMKDRQPKNTYAQYPVWHNDHFDELWWFPRNWTPGKPAHWDGDYPVTHWLEVVPPLSIDACTNLAPGEYAEEGDPPVDCLERHVTPQKRCMNCQMRRRLAYEQAAEKFATKMVRELMANDARGNFLAWDGHWSDVLDEIKIHVERLSQKISDAPGLHKAKDKKRVSELCADTANFLMKMDEQNGEGS
jgi:hypothetical protein